MPVAVVALIWALLTEHRATFGFGRLSRRGTLVLAWLLFQAALLTITELTSVGHHFRAPFVDLAWTVLLVCLLVLARHRIGPWIVRLRRLEVRARVRALGWEQVAWLAAVVLVMALVALDGLRFPPTNGDSLVYHLVRVAHWIQNGTIAPFATHYTAQVELAPLSEYNLALLHLTTGSDRLDWLMQWSSAVVCLVGVTELVRLLRGKVWAQVAAAVVLVTVPIGILLASSTENDYFTASIGIGLVLVALLTSTAPGWWWRSFMLGLAIGLGWMAKGTALPLLGPMVVVVALGGLLKSGRTRLQPMRMVSAVMRTGAAVVAGVAGIAAMALPFVIQTEQLFGSAVGPTSHTTIDSPINVKTFGASLLRNTASNFEIGNNGNNPETWLSHGVLHILGALYPAFHQPWDAVNLTLGVPPASPFAHFNYALYQRVDAFGANPWHVLLLLLATIVFLVGVLRQRREDRLPAAMALALWCGYALFWGTAKWSWHETRYSMPIFVVGSALIALALSRLHRWVTRVVLAGLLVACLPQVMNNAEHPVFSSPQGSYLAGYFPSFGNPFAENPGPTYEQTARAIAESTCPHVAMAQFIHVEYPLWVGLAHNAFTGTLDATDVHNATASIPIHGPICATLTQPALNASTPLNGQVNLQFGTLGLALQPDRARHLTMAIPGFTSTLPGARVFPGGHWVLALYPRYPWLAGGGTVVVTSSRARTARLVLTLTAHGVEPQVVGGVVGPDRTVSLLVHLRAGVTTIAIRLKPVAGDPFNFLVLHHVTITAGGM